MLKFMCVFATKTGHLFIRFSNRRIYRIFLPSRAAGPQDVKDSVEDGTKFGGARSPTRSRRRQNRRNKSPRRVRQIGVVESNAHRTVPLTRISALSRRTSTFQTPSQTNQAIGAGGHLWIFI